MAEHAHPQAVHEALAEATPEGGAGAPGRHVGHHGGEVDRHDDAQDVEATRHHAVVDADLGQQRSRLGGGGLDDHESHHQQHPPPMGAEQRPQRERRGRRRAVREVHVGLGMGGFGVEDVRRPVDHLVGDARERQPGGRVGLRRGRTLRPGHVRASHEAHGAGPSAMVRVPAARSASPWRRLWDSRASASARTCT